MASSVKSSHSLLPLYSAVFVAVLGFSLIAPFFPDYAMQLGASYSLLGVIVSIYGAVQLFTQIPMGRLSDRRGRKRMMLLGLLTFSILPLLYIHATDAMALLLIRALGGLGASAVWPIAMALIVDQSRPEARGSAMGWYNAAFFSALAAGPLLGGFAYDNLGIRAPFYLWALLGSASFLMVLFWVSEPERRRGVQSEGQSEGHATQTKPALITKGYVMTFLACSSVVLWSGVVGGFNFTMLPAFASDLGFSATDVGAIYLAYGGSTAICNIHFGRMADRGSRKRLIFVGCLAGAFGFAALHFTASLLAIVCIFAAIGMGLGMASPAAAALIADTTSPDRRGEVYGIFNTARMSGVVIGPLIAGFSADLHGVNGTVTAFAVLAAGIALCTLLLREAEASG